MAICHPDRPHRAKGFCDQCYKNNWMKTFMVSHPEVRFSVNNRSQYKIRRQVIDHYGGKCVCCGEVELIFLTMDHIEGGGQKQRRELGDKVVGNKMYYWIRANNYPDYFQVLCRNCNWAKHVLGVCPHQNKEQGSTKDDMGTPRIRTSDFSGQVRPI